MSARDEIARLQEQVQKSIIGQQTVIERLVIALLTGGNVLMEGLPGLAKTRAIKTIAANLESEFRRIQFTPDLLPSDITGTEVYFVDSGKGSFKFQPGPIFGNLILADEINRAPAKVQAALLEAMEERQVTVSGTTHSMPKLFMVLATQNPIEQEGTYPLPEAQMDRFMMHLFVTYGSEEDERKIIQLVRGEAAQDYHAEKPPEIAQQTIFEAAAEIEKVTVSPGIDSYIVDLITATREPQRYKEPLDRWIHVGASPRGGLAIDKASRAFAWLQGRDFVTPDDVRSVVHDCLRHRILLSYEANADGVVADDVINLILEQVAVA